MKGKLRTFKINKGRFCINTSLTLIPHAFTMESKAFFRETFGFYARL